MVIDLEGVSIIVPVFNSKKTIKKCLESLLNIDYPKHKLEIILVDDGSTDGTKEIIRHYSGVKLIEQGHKGPAATRNVGARKSSGKYIFFTDSDCIVRKDWIMNMLKEFRGNLAIVSGSLVPFSMKRPSEKFEQMRRERLYGVRRRLVEAVPSCNMAIKRRVFNEINGFDEDFKYASFEDYDLCRRVKKLNYAILYEPMIQVIHLHSSSWKGVFRRAFIHGMEGVKFRNKKGEKSRELIVLSSNIIFIPFKSLKYGPKFISGFIYEFSGILGELVGLGKYR
jgi:GT2 family glycosyltransferase